MGLSLINTELGKLPSGDSLTHVNSEHSFQDYDNGDEYLLVTISKCYLFTCYLINVMGMKLDPPHLRKRITTFLDLPETHVHFRQVRPLPRRDTGP